MALSDLINYRKARRDELAQLFQLYRTAMKNPIEQIWGWDEQWQEDDFSQHFEPDQITAVSVGEKLVGYVQVEPRREVLYIRMLVLAEDYRRKGIGGRMLELVLSAASKRHLGVKLQVFKINEAAKRFYERRDFRVVRETAESYEMEFGA